MIKNIIFDIGNVLIQNPTLEDVKKFFKRKEDAMIFNNYIFSSKLWIDFNLGTITEHEIIKEINEKKLITISDYGEVENFMLHWIDNLRANFDTMDIGYALKEKGYKIYLLSNMTKQAYDSFVEKYSFFSDIDGAIVSAYEGVMKPDVRIFEKILKKYSLKSDECVLIDDDDTGRTIDAAKSLGINCRRVVPNNAEDVKRLLNENGVQI